ncbi:MAG: AgmX/PglI C-terminal domain-containing protein [Gammaproteobacteria bacterium]|jgi:outer membrane biosynthesis protein TonB
MLFHSFELPWSLIQEEVERLKRLVVVFLAVTVVIGLIIPFIPVPKKDLSKEEKLPPRLAQLVMQQKEKPKPPPPKIEKKEEKKEKKKEEKKKEKKKEKPKKEEKKVEKKPEKTQAQKTAEARRKAQKSGLLAFADELADLRDKNVDQTLNKTKKLSKGAAESKIERNILTSNTTVPAGSGGIDTSKLSRGVTSGTQLQGRETTKVESGIEKVAKANQGKVTGSSSNAPKLSYEEVSIVFDRNKGSIYSLYNRALRKDPTIAGKFVVELTILPDGSVLDVKVVSSELGNEQLERKLLIKIRSFLFPSKQGAENLIVTFPVDFVPS